MNLKNVIYMYLYDEYILLYMQREQRREKYYIYIYLHFTYVIFFYEKWKQYTWFII